MANIIFSSALVLTYIPPSRSSNPLNSMTPQAAQQWQVQQDRLSRQAYQAARPPSSAADVVRLRR